MSSLQTSHTKTPLRISYTYPQQNENPNLRITHRESSSSTRTVSTEDSSEGLVVTITTVTTKVVRSVYPREVLAGGGVADVGVVNVDGGDEDGIVDGRGQENGQEEDEEMTSEERVVDIESDSDTTLNTGKNNTPSHRQYKPTSPPSDSAKKSGPIRRTREKDRSARRFSPIPTSTSWSKNRNDRQENVSGGVKRKKVRRTQSPFRMRGSAGRDTTSTLSSSSEEEDEIPAKSRNSNRKKSINNTETDKNKKKNKTLQWPFTTPPLLTQAKPSKQPSSIDDSEYESQPEKTFLPQLQQTQNAGTLNSKKFKILPRPRRFSRRATPYPFPSSPSSSTSSSSSSSSLSDTPPQPPKPNSKITLPIIKVSRRNLKINHEKNKQQKKKTYQRELYRLATSRPERESMADFLARGRSALQPQSQPTNVNNTHTNANLDTRELEISSSSDTDYGFEYENMISFSDSESEKEKEKEKSGDEEGLMDGTTLLPDDASGNEELEGEGVKVPEAEEGFGWRIEELGAA